MMLTDRQIKLIEKRIPSNLIKTRQNGGASLKYLSGSTVIDMLNNIFDYMWSWDVEKCWIESGYGNGKGGYVAHVLGTLTVYLQKEDGSMMEIKKTASGSKVIIGKINQQDSIYKSAGTDALKKAASLFGIGLELWRDKDEDEFFRSNRANEIFRKVWTEEKLKEYKEEWDYINNLGKEHGFNSLNEMYRYFLSQTGTKSELDDFRGLTPETIGKFVEYIKKQASQNK